MKEYGTYKLVILYFSLIDQLYENMFNKVPLTSGSSDAEWPTALADWIRHNDDVLLKVKIKIAIEPTLKKVTFLSQIMVGVYLIFSQIAKYFCSVWVFMD